MQGGVAKKITAGIKIHGDNLKIFFARCYVKSHGKCSLVRALLVKTGDL